MTTYPTGVLQNHAAPGNPPQLKPVGKQNWKMFATLADAQKGLEMIQTCVPGAQMQNAVEGMYSQFVYEDKDPDIRARLAYGKVGQLAIQEYPSDILDRSTNPQPFVDHYQPGQTPVLRCAPVTPDLGQLYWDAD